MANTSKSICRELLYETCDMTARLPGFEATYKRHMKNITFNNEEYRKHAQDVMVEFYKYMSEYITLFPMFGTLLGIIRSDSLIPHDNDIDFGYLKSEEDELIKALDNLHGKYGFVIVRNQFNNLYSVAHDTVLIDLYEYEENGPVFMQGHREFYNLYSHEVLPFKTITFHDTEMKCIQDPIAYFERYYGKDWRTPK
ncbi:MAG: LicD family protein [Planctomycetota bacterium]